VSKPQPARADEMSDVRPESLNKMPWNTTDTYPHIEAVKYKEDTGFNGFSYEE